MAPKKTNASEVGFVIAGLRSNRYATNKGVARGRYAVVCCVKRARRSPRPRANATI